MENEKLTGAKPIAEALMRRAKELACSEPPGELDVSELKRGALNASRHDAWKRLIAARGERYRGCRLGTFEVTLPDQQAVIERLLAIDIPALFAKRNNLVFFGPEGTGKDHLMIAMLYRLIGLASVQRTAECGDGSGVPGGEQYEACPSIHWARGCDLFADRRDAIGTEERESDFIYRYTSPQVLALSDPLPVLGELTDGQRELLIRILDRRYSEAKATWVTINVKSFEDAKVRMGPQLAARIRHNALAFFCNWPSYRKPVREIK